MNGHDLENRSTVALSASGELDWRNTPTRPIFLHSSFRTSSTWLWERFRRSPDTTAYYEIFHEQLADITPAQVMGNHHAAWESKHPAQAPYLIEFLNLMQGGKGIPEFDASMAFKSFIPAEGFNGTLTEQEKAYVSLLIRNATDNHKIPVLTCTRSVGRVGALVKAFPGCHILLYRRLFDQWASYSYHSLKGGNYFFEIMNYVIEDSDDDFISNIKYCFPVETVDVQDSNLFYRFVFFHLYIYAKAFTYCDIVMDATACRDPAHQATIEQKIQKATSLSIDLSGARRNFEISLLSVDDRGLFIDTIRQFSKMISGMAPSQEGGNFVMGLAEQLLEDWDQNEFHTRRIRTGYIECRSGLAAIEHDRNSLVEVEDQLVATTSAHDALVEKLAAAQNALEVSRREAADTQAHLLADLSHSRNFMESLSSELSETRTALEVLLNEKTALNREATLLKTTANQSQIELGTLRQAYHQAQNRFNEQASQVLRLEADLNVAMARNATLDYRLHAARTIPPTLMRRLARLRSRLLKT